MPSSRLFLHKDTYLVLGGSVGDLVLGSGVVVRSRHAATQ